jgi:hypothetical protein
MNFHTFTYQWRYKSDNEKQICPYTEELNSTFYCFIFNRTLFYFAKQHVYRFKNSRNITNHNFGNRTATR